MKAKKQTGLWIVIAFLSILAIALTGITFAWFTDKVTVDDFTLNFGKIELETSSTVTSKELPYTTADIKLTRGDQTLKEGSFAMPGDKVTINITVKLTENSQPAYYLVYFNGDNMFSCDRKLFFMEKDTSKNKHVYATNGTTSNEVKSDGTLDETAISTHLVGSITREDEAHEISFVQQIDKSATEAELSGKKTFSCTIYAIQQANMENEKAAYDEIYKQANKSVTFGTGAVITTGTGGDIAGMTALPSWKQAINDYYKYETISFYKTGNQPSTLSLNETLTDSFDEQQEKNNLETGLIKVYTNGTTELAFVSDYKIMAPVDCKAFFSNYELIDFGDGALIEIDESFTGDENAIYTMKFDNFYTDNTTDMSNMFAYQGLVRSKIDLSGWNVSNVTNMSWMFYLCQCVSLDVSGWDTSKVTNMQDMFYSSTFTSLDLSSFNTSKVTTMAAMFLSMDSLTSLDLSSFDTAT